MTVPAVRHPWPGVLDWGGDWLTETADELASLGFVLRDGSHPGSLPGPRLLVALRDQPTFAHFDPEEVSFWEVRDGRGRAAQIDRRAPVPFTRPFSWGRIRVSDRIPVSNEFLTFGGVLLGSARDEHATYLAFTSRAPIVRWAGHSQGVDPYTDEIGSFFARLMVPVDYQEGAEARIAACDPQGVYAMFLQYSAHRRRPGSPLRDADPSLAATLDHECRRLSQDAPAAWRDAEALLAWLQLG